MEVCVHACEKEREGSTTDEAANSETIMRIEREWEGILNKLRRIGRKANNAVLI